MKIDLRPTDRIAGFGKPLLLALALALLCLGASLPVPSMAQPAPSAATPASPNASANTVSLLRYLSSLPSRPNARVLSGQNIAHANHLLDENYRRLYVRLQAETGHAPAVIGVDYGSEQMVPRDIARANQMLIRHWREGGLVTISMSPSNPWTGGSLRDRTTGQHRFTDVVTPGTEPHRRWRATLDIAAAGLAELRDAGVVVLWRPVHEMNGDFFWWSAGAHDGWASPDDFRALWVDMFDYLTKVKKLDNLLWVYAPNYQSNDGVKPVTHYYPGDRYVDIVGLDYYENTLDRLDNGGSYSKLVALGKPFALTEVGPAFWLSAHPRGRFDTRIVIDAIRKKYPATTYFVFWQGWSAMLLNVRMGLAENLNARELMSDPWVVNRGGLDWRPAR